MNTPELFHRALAYHQSGNLFQAATVYREILKDHPNHGFALNNLGLILMDHGDLDEAVRCFAAALSVNHDDADAHNNLGNVFYRQGELATAVECYRKAIRINPRHTNGLCNLGNALKDQGFLSEAAECYRQALSLDPDHKWTLWNRCLLKLLQGNLDGNWTDLELRSTVLKTRTSFLKPRWNGEPLKDKTILVHAEMGLGDTIHFLRFLPLIQERGGYVVFECQQTLSGLVSGTKGIDQVIPAGAPLPAFDFHVPLLSLPGILGTTMATIPAMVPYLKADSGLIEFWRKELKSLTGFKVGIAWQGSPTFPGDKLRSIPLNYFEPLTRIPGIRLVSLQKGAGIEQFRDVSAQVPILDLGDRLQTMGDTAAVMTNLALVISSDTSIPHLAGALGISVWTVMQLIPDWRWFLGRSDSPWYLTMRLFRQQKLGDWGEVFRRIKIELEDLPNNVAKNQEKSGLSPGASSVHSFTRKNS